MKRLVLGVLVLPAGFLAAGTDAVDTFQNPIPVMIADPSVLRTEAGEFLYYLSGTGISRYASDDLVHWRRIDNWIDFADWNVDRGVWASEAVEHDGRFYYHFSTHLNEGPRLRRIHVAVADSPDDTFRPHASPLWEDEFGWIDSHIVIDDDNTPWLFVTNDLKSSFAGKARIMVAELEPDISAIKGEFTFLMEPQQPWEHAWQEGAAVLRRGDTWYMTFSSQLYASDRYSIGYATAPHPRGPWTKAPENPIFAQRVTTPDTIGYAGPGHNGFVLSPDGNELFMVYHTRRNSPESGNRQLNIDRVRFEPNDDGPERLVVANGSPTRTPQPIPSGAMPHPRGTGDEFDGDALDLSKWPAIYGPQLRWVAVRDGALEILCLPTDVHRTQSGGANLLLQHPPAGEHWSITTRVHFDPRQNFEQAFLMVWRDSNNYLALKSLYANGQRHEAAIEIAEEYRGTQSDDHWSTDTWLRLRRAGGTRYAFEVSRDGEAWHPVGPEREFPHDNVMVGLGAWRPGSDRRLVAARFKFFRVESLEPDTP